ncbi:MAG: hypothetical protein AAGU27_27260 [Dehalobacterium sp.]
MIISSVFIYAALGSVICLLSMLVTSSTALIILSTAIGVFLFRKYEL